MNNMIKKALSTTEEFLTSSNRLSLIADSILDRIIPKATAHAAYRECRWVTCGACGYVPCYSSAQRLWCYECRDCAYQGSNLCGPWRPEYATCKSAGC